jgi:phosphoglycolate phosphatase-like HAD superfamily hydrolase
MNTERAPASALDDILSQARYLLLDFDGPICSLFAGTPTAPVAGRLRAVLRRHGVALPAAIEGSGDWFAILAFAASADSRAGAGAEAELAVVECRAARTAAPTAHAGDVLAACAQADMPVAVVSNNSGLAVRGYLAERGLDGLVAAVAARTGNDPAQLKPSPYLVDVAAQELGAATADCVLVGDSPADMQAARVSGARGVGLGAEPADLARLAAAGADAVISGMGDLVPALRARCGNLG